MVEEKDFRRRELPGKYAVKMLYDWDNGKFKDEYLRKLEINWENWKRKDKMTWNGRTSSSGVGTLKGG